MTSFFELFKRSVFDDLTAYAENPMKSTKLKSNDNTKINLKL